MHIYFFPIYFDQTQFSLRAIRTYIFRISNTYSYISQFPNFSLLQMLYFVLTHFVSAGTAVAPPSFLHPPLLLQLYVSAVLLHCLIKLACIWNIWTRTAPGFPSSAFLSCYLHPVWLPVAARWGTLGGKIASPSPIESVVVCCQLSSMCWGNRCASWVLSDTLTDRKPTWSCHRGFLLDKRQMKPFTCHPLLASNSNIKLLWSLCWYADCSVGEYFNHTRVRNIFSPLLNKLLQLLHCWRW